MKQGIPIPHGVGKVYPGDVLYKNFDDDPTEIYSGAGTADNPGDQRIIGNSTPRYHYGITAGVGWKAFYPRVYANNGVNTDKNHWVQSKYLADASYLKLQNITLSYTLPKAWCTKVHFDQIKVFATGENLYTWDHLPEGLETDMLTKGAWEYPFMRKFSFGINVTF